MDLGKSRPDRFCQIRAIWRPEEILWVRRISRIARARADFNRFSEMFETAETEVWSRVDLNPQPLLRLSIENLLANLVAYSALIKSSRAGEIIIAGYSPAFLSH